MDKLYDLKLYTFPNGEERERNGIGLFTSREEAELVSVEYLESVPGFRDYYCEPEVTEVPVIGDGKDVQQVYRFIGWNTDGDGDETDILESACYVSPEQARADYENAQKTDPRQEWALNHWNIGQKEWQEGFVREYPSGRKAQTLKEVRAALEQAMEPRQLMKICFHYENQNRYFFPLRVEKDLFLSTEEFDFLLDGFTVRRVRDVEKANPGRPIFTDIMTAEGWPDRLTVPDVDLSDWQRVFASLQKLGRNIIVEEEHLDRDSKFIVGAIESVTDDRVSLLRFDADGFWDTEPVEIFYRDITSVSFDTRYINVFSKYLPPKP